MKTLTLDEPFELVFKILNVDVQRFEGALSLMEVGCHSEPFNDTISMMHVKCKNFSVANSIKTMVELL